MPGNPGIAGIARCHAGDAASADAVLALCSRERIDFVVVGPEIPLVAGIADALGKAGIACLGPSADAARLEGSKGFTKALCSETGIPTAAYQQFSDREAALAHLDKTGVPIVVKADGLAAGKGVTVAHDMATAREAITDCLAADDDSVVLEAFLEGEEASLFVLCHGRKATIIGTAQDHKAVGEGDTGPNTGGMGAYAPAPVMSSDRLAEAMETIILPTLNAMADRGTPFTGILFAGLMITVEGVQLIEYNVRFGDPECQALCALLEGDLLECLHAASRGDLESAATHLRFRPGVALTIVMANAGYPGDVALTGPITLPDPATHPGVVIQHAGTTAASNGRLMAKGGRVLNVTATAPTVGAARAAALAVLERIDWTEGFFRRDIGWRAIAREGKGQE